MPFFFTKREDPWLRTVANDYGRYRSRDKEASTFIDRAVTAWTQQFPYRHPRLRNHFPHTEREDQLVQWWGDYWKVHERMRHQLNWTMEPQFKQLRTMPAGSMSGLVEIGETLEGIAAKLRGEGFLHPGNQTPYARDPRLNDLTLRTATRLAMYPDIDFAACTQNERQRAILDLPGDLEDILTIFNANTGAEIYATAVWRDSTSSMCMHEATTPRSTRFLKDDHKHVIRQAWLKFQRKETWHRMSVGVGDAAPSVYGSFDGSWKPTLPSWTPSLTSANRLIRMYLEYLWVWQGGVAPLPRESPDGTMLVIPDRLPADYPDYTDPDSWDDIRTQSMWLYIHQGQEGKLAAARMFQFNISGDEIEADVLRVDICPGSSLRYDAESRLYVARILARQPNDLLAQCELVDQLPQLPDQMSVYQPLTEAEYSDAKAHAVGEEAEDLLASMLDYEFAGPVHMTRGGWKTLYETLLFIPETPPARGASIEYLSGWWLPEEYFQRTPDPGWTMKTFSNWVRSNILVHKPTGTLFGGPWGLKWPVLLLIRALWALTEMRDGHSAPFTRPSRDRIASDLQVVGSDILWLAAELDRSCKTLMQMRKTAAVSSHQKVQPAQFSVAERHVPPPFLPDNPESARAESPHGPKSRGNRPRGTGILKKPKLRDRVEVVLPKPEGAKGKESTAKRTRIGGTTTQIISDDADALRPEDESQWQDEDNHQPEQEPQTPKKKKGGAQPRETTPGSGSSSGRPRKRHKRYGKRA